MDSSHVAAERHTPERKELREVRAGGWRNVEGHDHDALLPLLAPSPRALSARGQPDGLHRHFPHRLGVCPADAGRVTGLAWFPHACPHRRVPPGLWSYGLPEQAGKLGESPSHGLSGNLHVALRCVLASSRHSRSGAAPASASLRPENSAGIATQIVERDEVGLIALANVARHTGRPSRASTTAGHPDGILIAIHPAGTRNVERSTGETAEGSHNCGEVVSLIGSEATKMD